MKKEIEIERRFLLKQFPNACALLEITIHQFYVEENGEICRYRRLIDDDFQEIIYNKIIKKNISKGINEETKFEITAEDYLAAYENPSVTFIHKNRHVFRDEDSGPFFEVDVFKRKTPLIICEVELNSLEQELKIPHYIQEVIDREITGEVEYSNYNLSLDGQNLQS